MKLKPRAVLAIIASPEKDPPAPGAVYEDLVKIGQRWHCDPDQRSCRQ
jgi:hypothetical protein